MSHRWVSKVGRISTMSGAEICTRLGQEYGKHSDLVRFRLGLPEIGRTSRLGEERGAFFWEYGEARVRANLVRSQLPDDASRIIEEAEQICSHRFRILGFESLDFGTPIDWHFDPVNKKRASKTSWFRVPFLDFEQVGDHKIIWELNRHQHLVTLAKAWALGGDQRYVRELIEQWLHWKQSNPYPLGINWASSLEVAFRTLSWIWVDHLLEAAEGTEAFRKALRAEIAFQGRYIERFLSTYFSPNTHLLGELTALFFAGTLYPWIPAAERWRTSSWKALVAESQKQVRPDGVYFEQSLYYHVYAFDLFLHARRLAQVQNISVPAHFDLILNRMLDLVQALSQAGPAEGFGDDDGGRVFNSGRNRTEHMNDPLATGSLLFGRDDLKTARLTEESIWLFGEKAAERLATEPAKSITAQSAAFPDGGVYVMAGSETLSGRSANHQMMVDAGPQGTASCGHGHADALSLRLTIAGRRWLVDSGTGLYMGPERSIRDWFRGTSAHNTLRVDAADQAVPENTFAWKSIPRTVTRRWAAPTTFSYFFGSHNGYERLASPVTHRRSVFATKEGVWLVRDMVEGTGSHDLEINWHFEPMLEIESRQELIRSWAPDSDLAVHMLFAGSPGWQPHISRSGYSPVYGQIQQAPWLCMRARTQLPTEIGTALLLQSRLSEDQKAQFQFHSHDGVHAYHLRGAATSRTFFFAARGRSWQAGRWSSDAEVLYFRLRGNDLWHLVMVGGSYARFAGTPIVQANDVMDWFEWQLRGAESFTNSSCGDIPPVNTNQTFADAATFDNESILSVERP